MTGDRTAVRDGSLEAAAVQSRVRRFAVLRAAQRSLQAIAPPEELAEALDLGRRILRRLRALSGENAGADVLDDADALRGVDALLERLAGDVRDVLKNVPLRALCSAVAPLAQREPGTLRSLGAVVLEGDLDSDAPLRFVEFLVTALCCDGHAGERIVVRRPLDAMPELADVDEPAAHESHPAIDEAEQIFGRAVRRLDADDLGATRDRIRAFKRRLGPRILHPTVMAAAVAYNAAMANRLERLLDEHRALDSFADTLLGPESGEARPDARAVGALLATLPTRTRRTRLFWQTLATAGLTVGLLTLAVLLWPRSSVEVLAAPQAAALSPHLVAGYVSGEDGTNRFLGTLGDSWTELDVSERRRAVARIAALLDARGIRSVILVDGERQIQARHEGDVLLWVTAPAGAP